MEGRSKSCFKDGLQQSTMSFIYLSPRRIDLMWTTGALLGQVLNILRSAEDHLRSAEVQTHPRLTIPPRRYRVSQDHLFHDRTLKKKSG